MLTPRSPGPLRPTTVKLAHHRLCDPSLRAARGDGRLGVQRPDQRTHQWDSLHVHRGRHQRRRHRHDVGTVQRCHPDRPRRVVQPGTGWLPPRGDVFAHGSNSVYGSPSSAGLSHPIVGMAAGSNDMGYWLVASDGGLFAFGDASFYGSMGAPVLNAPIVGMAATADGKGYWLVASDGGVFAFGDAHFYGSTGGTRLNAPIVGMASDGRRKRATGSWPRTAGCSTSGRRRSTARPVLAPTSTPPSWAGPLDAGDGNGYWMVASDGGVFAFGSAGFDGSPSAHRTSGEPIVGMARARVGVTFWPRRTAASSPTTRCSTGRKQGPPS